MHASFQIHFGKMFVRKIIEIGRANLTKNISKILIIRLYRLWFMSMKMGFLFRGLGQTRCFEMHETEKCCARIVCCV